MNKTYVKGLHIKECNVNQHSEEEEEAAEEVAAAEGAAEEGAEEEGAAEESACMHGTRAQVHGYMGLRLGSGCTFCVRLMISRSSNRWRNSLPGTQSSLWMCFT